jgi:NAD(P)-dependent dehydrogenase (short-subunit alcohol dehydrogenase family)
VDIATPAQLLDFRGKVVIVTGGGRGLGAGIALRFAQAGAAVVVGYHHSQAEAQSVVEAIQGEGGRATAVSADLRRREDVEGLIARGQDTFGRLDALINNAGVYPLASLLDMKDEDWDLVVDSNLRSVHLCTQAAARAMIARGEGGAIVNIASIEGTNPAPGHSHYDAAKAGVLQYTRAAALELGPSRIRVNAVSPGLIWRPGLDRDWPEGVERYARAVPLGRLGQPDDVADACLFLASPASRWITGSELVVDGGVLTHTVY